MIEIRKCSIAEVEANANFNTLAREYANECAVRGLPDPVISLEGYRPLEASPMFQGFAAFLGDLVIGFVAVLTPTIPHYGATIAVTESLFVAGRYRHTGAGIKLLRAAEAHAKASGAPGLLVSAPVGGRLERVLPRLGYRETNRVFFKRNRDA